MADARVEWVPVIRVPPLVIACAAAAAQAVVVDRSAATRGSRIGAGVLAAASSALLASSVSAFRRQGTTVDPVAVDRVESLVTTGVLRLTRNPMYVGMAGLLVAHVVLRRSPAACVPAAAFVVVIDRSQIPAEERALRKRFGRAFDDYAHDVPRWLGPRSLLGLPRPRRGCQTRASWRG